MSVDRTDYLMLAVDVGYEAFDWEKHEAEIEGRPEARFDVVYDGMSGKYCLAGKIIAKSDPYEGIDRTEIDPAKLDVGRADLAAKVSDAFGRQISPDEFRLLLFSHFS